MDDIFFDDEGKTTLEQLVIYNPAGVNFVLKWESQITKIDCCKYV